jgi:hypothetical protein
VKDDIEAETKGSPHLEKVWLLASKTRSGLVVLSLASERARIGLRRMQLGSVEMYSEIGWRRKEGR